MTIALDACAAVLFSLGTYLVLQRKLSRIIIGLGLLTHGANVLLIASGRIGFPPIVGIDLDTMSDPLPQALALTAIVISFAVTTFLLALAYRSWQLTDDDEVADDVGDRLLSRDRTPGEEVTDQEEAMPEPVEATEE